VRPRAAWHHITAGKGGAWAAKRPPTSFGPKGDAGTHGAGAAGGEDDDEDGAPVAASDGAPCTGTPRPQRPRGPDLLAASPFRRVAASHLISELLRPHPLSRLAAADAAVHPTFWPDSAVVQLAAACSDVLRAEYGVMPGSASARRQQRAGRAAASGRRGSSRQERGGALSPLLQLLEGEYARRRGTDAAAWAADLSELDRRAGRVWGPLSGAADGAGASAARGGKDWKAPAEYAAVYAGRGLGALGILRACRNIASAHITEFVAGGLFSSAREARSYFVDSFPWLFLKVAEAGIGASLLASRPPRSRGTAAAVRVDPSMGVAEEAARLAQRLLLEGERPRVLRAIGSVAGAILADAQARSALGPADGTWS